MVESSWYVAGINGKDESQKLALNLSSLTKQNSRVVLFEDSGTAKNPWKISYRKVRGNERLYHGTASWWLCDGYQIVNVISK